MTIYASDTQLYSCFERLFAVIENHDPQAANALLKASLAIRFDCVAPRASKSGWPPIRSTACC